MGKIFWWTESEMLYAINCFDSQGFAQRHDAFDLRQLIADGYIEVSQFTARQLGLPS